MNLVIDVDLLCVLFCLFEKLLIQESRSCIIVEKCSTHRY